MRLFGWFLAPRRDEIEREREETRQIRGRLATKVVELENQRFHLDDMVRRSLKLMEPK